MSKVPDEIFKAVIGYFRGLKCTFKLNKILALHEVYGKQTLFLKGVKYISEVFYFY